MGAPGTLNTMSASVKASEFAKQLKRTPSEDIASKSCSGNLKGYTDVDLFMNNVSKGAAPFDAVLSGVRERKQNSWPLQWGIMFSNHVRADHPTQVHHPELMVVPKPAGHVPADLFEPWWQHSINAQTTA